MASQMADAQLLRTTLEITAPDPDEPMSSPHRARRSSSPGSCGYVEGSAIWLPRSATRRRAAEAERRRPRLRRWPRSVSNWLEAEGTRHPRALHRCVAGEKARGRRDRPPVHVRLDHLHHRAAWLRPVSAYSVGNVSDLACVVHCHSTYSDGTGTVAQIARRSGAGGRRRRPAHRPRHAGGRRRGEEGWHGPVLVCVGEEVSPRRREPLPGLRPRRGDRPHGNRRPGADRRGGARGGGFGFAAHPFSKGSELFARAGTGMPWGDLEDEELDGLEVWSLVTDVAERCRAAATRCASSPRPARGRPPAGPQPGRVGPPRRAPSRGRDRRRSTPTRSACGSAAGCRCG